MTPTEYQVAVARTLPKEAHLISNHDTMILWCACGLSGESGEVMELVKKGIFHQHGIHLDKMKKELGDVLWYVAGLCTVMGWDLGQIMQDNIAKLKARYPDGFSAEASQNRSDI